MGRNHLSFVVCGGCETKAASLLYKMYVNQNIVTNSRTHSNHLSTTEIDYFVYVSVFFVMKLFRRRNVLTH